MRRVLPCLVLAFAAHPVAAVAQTASQPSLVLSMFGGVQAGYAVWGLDRQPLCVLDATNACTTVLDTLQLSRRAGSTLTAGASAIYFPWPHLGVHAQLAYQGFPLDDECSGLVINPDPDNPVSGAPPRNEQVCNSISRSGVPGGSMSALVGVVLRGPPGRQVSPFIRLGAGLVHRPQSSLDLVGEFATSADNSTAPARRTLIFDEGPHRTWMTFYLSAGVTAPLAPGYQLRLELHDLVSGVEQPAGPADAAGRVATATRTTHAFALTLGLDIVLEQRRRHRY